MRFLACACALLAFSTSTCLADIILRNSPPDGMTRYDMQSTTVTEQVTIEPGVWLNAGNVVFNEPVIINSDGYFAQSKLTILCCSVEAPKGIYATGLYSWIDVAVSGFNGNIFMDGSRAGFSTGGTGHIDLKNGSVLWITTEEFFPGASYLGTDLKELSGSVVGKSWFGDAINITFTRDASSRVVLVAMPEPSSSFLGTVALMLGPLVLNRRKVA